MRTARARDVWFSKCGKKAVVRAPARSVNLDGDGKRFPRKKGEKVEIEIDISLARRVCRMTLDTFMTRRGNAIPKKKKSNISFRDNKDENVRPYFVRKTKQPPS